MRGLGPTMTAQGQSIGISIGMLDRLIRTTFGLKRGAPSRAGPGAVAPLATLKRRLCVKEYPIYYKCSKVQAFHNQNQINFHS
jgi:hypothetical protein